MEWGMSTVRGCLPVTMGVLWLLQGDFTTGL